MDNPTTHPRWSVEPADHRDDAPIGRSPAEQEHDCTGGHGDLGYALPDPSFPYDGLPLPPTAGPDEAQVVDHG